ncbi:putative quinol monooxygenase [Actinomadura sp. NPDC047616]|uniref:putative quinol monooxygenase n=1 Tax=Actinomadura sp. NPDC047616 TaxID=3155914 RepID=UPI003411ECCA
MFVVIVTLRVRPGRLDEFLAGIQANARASRREPGCLRFDVLRTAEDPYEFVLYEIYRDEAAFYREHRSAPHYAAWKAVAAECLAEGGHVNRFCAPAFPDGIPDGPRSH